MTTPYENYFKWLVGAAMDIVNKSRLMYPCLSEELFIDSLLTIPTEFQRIQDECRRLFHLCEAGCAAYPSHIANPHNLYEAVIEEAKKQLCAQSHTT